MQTKLLNVSIFLLAFTSGSAVALAAPASGQARGATTRPTHSTQALPASLRPVLYQALAKDAEPAYRVNKDGCAVLPKPVLKACFDANGAHFSRARAGATLLALHLIASGRDAKLAPVSPVRPEINGNRVSYAHVNLNEWWRVLPVGFEQGFTIAKRPSGSGELTLALSASGQASQQKGALAWGQLRYGDLVVTDTNGKVIPATLRSKGGRVLIAINDVHATYPLTVDPLIWLAQEVTASDGATNDKFGTSVAVWGTTALVGAPQAEVNGNNAQGAVYVFTYGDGTWSQSQKLTTNDGSSSQQFGTAIAMDDGTALIGAYGANGNNPVSGAAYVFTDSDGTWTQQAKLMASDGATGDLFGCSVALNGNTAIVGARQVTVGSNSGQGAAYVFTNAGGSWNQAQKLTASDGASLDEFGYAVAVDGVTAMVGAATATVNSNAGQGAAYVFSDSGGSWSQTQKLTANDGVTGDYFGYSIGLTANTVFIGAARAKIYSNTFQGAVYVFTESDGSWSQAQKLIASDGATLDEFGGAIALSGTTAIIGAELASTPPGSYKFQGAAYVFTNSGGTWSQTQKITPTALPLSAYFGSSVSLDDGTALIGAFFETIGNNSTQGAAYFEGESDLGLAVSAPQTVGQNQAYVSQTIATNNASATSPAVAVTVTVPAAASFVSATATQGSCSEVSGVVTCDFGQINGNAGTASANVTLKATGSVGTMIENTASVAAATPALTASAPTTISATCPDGYTRYDGSLNPGKVAHSPIYQAPAGQENGILTGPAGFQLYVVFQNAQGRKVYPIPGNEAHKYAPAGTYTWVVKAGASGGAYTLCIMHP